MIAFARVCSRNKVEFCYQSNLLATAAAFLPTSSKFFAPHSISCLDWFITSRNFGSPVSAKFAIATPIDVVAIELILRRLSVASCIAIDVLFATDVSLGLV